MNVSGNTDVELQVPIAFSKRNRR